MLDYKDYQQRVLDLLDVYLDTLFKHKTKAEKLAARNLLETDPDLISPIPDWPVVTWTEMQSKGLIAPRPIDGKDGGYAVPFSPRTDGAGNSVPSICYKIPTGGGKTLLATASLSSIFSRLLHRNTGFVLWVIPNEAIYTQTKKALTNRDHPYRQLLDKAAAGRLKILEKDDRLDERDVKKQLCIMLLMLPSANRETKSTLKVFRDRGSVTGFFPDESDCDGHTALMQKTSNLDRYQGGLYPQVKTSLGNALRVIRPIIVMDEQQKAMSALALKTLYSFNPQFMLELSATPKDMRQHGHLRQCLSQRQRSRA
jgi:type III restriction enzyme